MKPWSPQTPSLLRTNTPYPHLLPSLFFTHLSVIWALAGGRQASQHPGNLKYCQTQIRQDIPSWNAPTKTQIACVFCPLTLCEPCFFPSKWTGCKTTSCPQDLFGGVGAPCSSSLAGPERLDQIFIREILEKLSNKFLPQSWKWRMGPSKTILFETIGPFSTFHDYGRKDAIRISLVSVVWLFLGMFENSFHINFYVHGSTTLHN